MAGVADLAMLDLPSDARALGPGDIVDSFVILRAVGAGGSADVYEAEHLHLGRRRALKVVRHSEGGDEVLARFRRETSVAGVVRHPHVADVFDTGLTDRGDPYLVVELLDGETLDAWIADGPLPAEAAIEATRQLLDALEHVHASGIVHRDVKPGNVMMHRDSTGAIVVKLIDFGICRRPALDAAGEVEGTPQYMAPELFDGVSVHPAHDVYAAGAVLFECLTGTPPYDGRASWDAIRAVRNGPAPDVRKRRPHCPAALVEIVGRAIARDPETRFTRTSELRAALDEVGDVLGYARGTDALRIGTPPCGCEIADDGAVSWTEPSSPLGLGPRSGATRSWHVAGVVVAAIGIALAAMAGIGAVAGGALDGGPFAASAEARE